MANPSLNPTSFRYPLQLPDNASPEDIVSAVRYHSSGILDLNQAIVALKQQVDTASTTATSAATAASSVVSSGVTSFNTLAGNVTYFPRLGYVNDQLGQPAYTTQPTDNGAKIIVGDSSTVVVTLNAGVGTPWFTIIDNDSSSTATLTPSSGTLNGPHHIPPGGFGIVYFDGVYFWAGVAPPIGIDSTVATAKLTSGGTQGSLTFIGGSCVSSTQAT